jgi:hypothetical protein
MKIDDLRNLSSAPGIDASELIKQGALGSLPLYTVIKENIIVFYDEVDFSLGQDGQGEKLTVAEQQVSVTFSRGEVHLLSHAALEELWLHKRLDAEKLAYVFSTPNKSLRFNSVSAPYFVAAEDVYAPAASLERPVSERSGRSEDSYTQAIRFALVDQGMTASNEDIFNWIRTQVEDFNPDHKCFDEIDCEGDELVTYETAKADDFVLTSSGKPIRKRAFREQCSRVKRGMK